MKAAIRYLKDAHARAQYYLGVDLSYLESLTYGDIIAPENLTLRIAEQKEFIGELEDAIETLEAVK